MLSLFKRIGTWFERRLTKLWQRSKHPTEPSVVAFESLPDFEYSSCPLTSGCIRVVRLLPGPGPLRCVLETAPLGSQYNAVSYTWGKDTPAHLIQIGEQQLALRANIYDFLRYARMYLSLKLPFWIDTICINQDDLAEWNEQVHRMDKIFLGATTVIAWLGASPTIRKPLYMLDDIARLRTDDERTEYFGSRPSKRDCDFFWDALYTFRPLYFLDYWTRVWIVPEVLLAKRLELMAADVVKPWKTLEAFSSSYDRYLIDAASEGEHKYELTAGNGGPPLRGFDGGDEYHDARQMLNSQLGRFLTEMGPMARSKTMSFDLPNILRLYGLSNCIDLRDRVFALLTLADNRCGLAADYSISTYDLFFQVVTQVGQTWGSQEGPTSEPYQKRDKFFYRHVSNMLEIDISVLSTQYCDYTARAWRATAAISDRVRGLERSRTLTFLFQLFRLDVLVVRSRDVRFTVRSENCSDGYLWCQQYLHRHRDIEPWCATALNLCQEFDLKIDTFLSLPVRPRSLRQDSTSLHNRETIGLQRKLKLKAWTPSFIQCLSGRAAELSSEIIEPCFVPADRIPFVQSRGHVKDENMAMVQTVLKQPRHQMPSCSQPPVELTEPGHVDIKQSPSFTFIQLRHPYEPWREDVDRDSRRIVRLLALASSTYFNIKHVRIILVGIVDYSEYELSYELDNGGIPVTQHIHQFKGLFACRSDHSGLTTEMFEAVVLTLNPIEDIWELLIRSWSDCSSPFRESDGFSVPDEWVPSDKWVYAGQVYVEDWKSVCKFNSQVKSNGSHEGNQGII